jgi:hypothetical protein
MRPSTPQSYFKEREELSKVGLIAAASQALSLSAPDPEDLMPFKI